MPSLKNFWLETLCCISLKKEDQHGSSSALDTLHQPHSTISLNLSASAIPHGSIGSKEKDAAALRQIFSSSSSIRGYQTATAPTSSALKKSDGLEPSTKTYTTSPSKRKKINRFEEIGRQVKQRLSAASLNISRPQTPSKISGHHAYGVTDDAVSDDIPLGTSYVSSGLSDLLAVRSVSQGGYDSDARTIHTPLLQSATSTIKANSELVPQSTIRQYPPATLDQSVYSLLNSPLVSVTSSHTHHNQMPIANPESHVPCSKTSTSHDFTIGSPIMSDACQQSTNSDQASQVAHIVMSATREEEQGSQPGNGDVEGKDRETTVIHEINRVSLISNIDPVLIDFIPRRSSKISLVSVSSSATEDDVGKDNVDQIAADGHSDASAPGPDQASSEPPPSATSIMDVEPLHLDKMRISQHLASMSQIHVPTSTESPLTQSPRTSLKSQDNQTDSYIPSLPRFPTWISIEHNRKPSDPTTKELFEKNGSGNKQRSLWTTVTSMDSRTASPYAIHRRRIPQGDSSSFYPSDEELPLSREASTSRTVRATSFRNPNSIAIGGRSASQPISLQRPDTARLSSSSFDERLAFLTAPLASHSTSTNNNQSTQRPMPFQPNNSALAISLRDADPFSTSTGECKAVNTTEANEGMSEVSINHNINRRNENMSEIPPIDVASILHRRSTSFSKGLRVSHLHSRISGNPLALQNEVTDDGNLNGSNILRPNTYQTSRSFDSRDSQVRYPDAVHLDPVHRSQGRKRDIARQSRRSRSADGDRPSTATRSSPVLRKAFSTSPFAQSFVPTTYRSSSIFGTKKSKNHKRSLADIRQRFATFTSHDSGNSRHGLRRDLFGAWARFPIHTRDLRSSPATLMDGVRVYDFGADHRPLHVLLPPKSRASDGRETSPLSATPYLHDRPISKKEKLNYARARTPFPYPKRTSSRELSANHSTSHRRSQQKGVRGLWKFLRRSTSVELPKSANDHAYKSSMSLDNEAEYPELECRPGEGKLTDTEAMLRKLRTDGPQDSSDDQDMVASPDQQETEPVSECLPKQKDWANIYGECVETFPAQLSNVDMTGGPLTKVPDIRQSTTAFYVQSEERREKAHADLMKNLDQITGGSGSTEGQRSQVSERKASSSSESNELKMPGSF